MVTGGVEKNSIYVRLGSSSKFFKVFSPESLQYQAASQKAALESKDENGTCGLEWIVVDGKVTGASLSAQSVSADSPSVSTIKFTFEQQPGSDLVHEPGEVTVVKIGGLCEMKPAGPYTLPGAQVRAFLSLSLLQENALTSHQHTNN